MDHSFVDDRGLRNQKRLAKDGVAYTKQEFQDFYGEQTGHYRWLQADPAGVASDSSPIVLSRRQPVTFINVLSCKQ